MKQLAQLPTARRQQSWDLNPVKSKSEGHALATQSPWTGNMDTALECVRSFRFPGSAPSKTG